ncbi:Chromophore lyase CpcS/CpeS 1 [Hyella patelloides LEGE 07179]|uniref:Chromophore lyase CpcS/CpeS n=2 Tax=Hyella patelloides LEGE 07179 TaxID=945734 RepID=A0A563VUX5_9CYAN|nr:phycobiliprotein lyase [Hyella patelloides]VEP15213.1 Chromophore lyase CpcS/CpeS 1 [Hyella patelloides LEGE 07179]
MNDSVFQQFFTDCVGEWVSERTYHYLNYQEIERSRTDFTIKPLTSEQKTKILTDNTYKKSGTLESFPGFNLGFYTINDKGEEVQNNLNLMFVPTIESGDFLEGDYLRDIAYEEARPIVANFRFNHVTKELLMTTNYTRVVSVDSIIMTNPNLRIRRILNYQRPPEGQPLETILLAGFGVEQKGS